MPARVIIVLPEPGAAQEVANLLPLAARYVLSLCSSLTALNALEAAENVAVLVACSNYPPGQPNGVSLIRMARRKRPRIRAVFIGEARHEPLVAGLGLFLASPAQPASIAQAVQVLLASETSAAA